MKTNAITVPVGNIYDPILEALLQKRDTELKVLVEKNAKTFAQRNLPALEGDNLLNYTSEIKAGYEKMAADTFHYLQPETHFPEAKADAEYFRDKVKTLDTEINDKEAQNKIDQNSLQDFAQNNIPSRILWAMVATLIITLGEIMFNTKAFQVTGESLLFALILSICISMSVFLFAHITPMLYKSATTKIKRISVVGGALFLVTCLFTALAIFRSTYLSSHDVHVKPHYFVIINLFFFIVSALISYFILPSWTEIKQNALYLKIHYQMKKRSKEIGNLKEEREKIRITILERTKVRIRIAHYANYAAERIKKMYYESIGIFKTTNLTYRTDNTPPDCFLEDTPAPNIDNFFYSLIPNDTQS